MYAPFKVRKFELLFYKLNTLLQKIALVAGRVNILCKYIIFVFLNFWRGFCDSKSMLFLKAPYFGGKNILK